DRGLRQPAATRAGADGPDRGRLRQFGRRGSGRGRRDRAEVDVSIPLPAPLRIYQYRPLTVFSLMDTDTDRVLPQLFEMCVKGGRSSRSRTNPADFDGYRSALLDGGFVRGFTS